MSSVLNGVKVLELCEVFQGPLAGQTLADFGADVLKIERPERGDSLRHSDTVANAAGMMSSYFAATNRNKRSVCLDLKDGADRDILLDLVKGADVLLHNYRPGVMEKLQLDYEVLSKLNPRLIYAAASGFGDQGPCAQMAGQDILIQSMSGLSWKTTSSSKEPVFLNVPVSDFTSGMLLAQGVLLALLERTKSGKGQVVNVSLLSTLVAMQSLEVASLLNYNYETTWYDRALNFTAGASDGWISVLGFFRENPLRLICEGLGLPDLSISLNMPDKASQAVGKDQIAEHIRPVIATMTVEQSVQKLQDAGVLAAPIMTLDEILKHPQVSANNWLTSVPVDGQKPMQLVANPVVLSRTPATVRCGPPRLDEYRDELLKKNETF